MKLIGNQAFASCVSKALNEMIPAFFTIATQLMHTILCMQSYRDGIRVMKSKMSQVCSPPTKKSWKSLRQKRRTGDNILHTHVCRITQERTLLITVIIMDAMQ